MISPLPNWLQQSTFETRHHFWPEHIFLNESRFEKIWVFPSDKTQYYWEIATVGPCAIY